MTIKLTDRFLTSRKPPTAGRARAGTHPEGKARQGGVRVNREVQRQRRLDLYPKSPMLTSTASGVCDHGASSKVALVATLSQSSAIGLSERLHEPMWWNFSIAWNIRA